eukprot:Colp12_sorted_trinity150504_noHs@2968
MDFAPEHNDEYAKKDYWEERYEQEESYEWFRGYKDFRDLVLKYVKRTDTILMVGCGNSALTEDMYHDGFTNIVSMDFSQTVIERMTQKHADKPTLKWDTMDMMAMSYPDRSFDVVIEKGTLDAVLVSNKDPWKLNPELDTLVQKTLGEITRVLKDDGAFISITFAQPHFRKPLIEKRAYNWKAEYYTFGEQFHYYFYIVQKQPAASLSGYYDEQERIEAEKSARNQIALRPRKFSEDEDFLNRVGMDSDDEFCF